MKVTVNYEPEESASPKRRRSSIMGAGGQERRNSLGRKRRESKGSSGATLMDAAAAQLAPTSPAPVFQPPWLQNSSAARPSTAPAFAVRNASPDVTRVSTPASTLCGAHVAELYSRLDALRLAANRSSTARPALGGSSLATASTGDTSALRADLIATELQQARRRVSK